MTERKIISENEPELIALQRRINNMHTKMMLARQGYFGTAVPNPRMQLMHEHTSLPQISKEYETPSQ